MTPNSGMIGGRLHAVLARAFAWVACCYFFIQVFIRI
jgi:hypothetical protein